MEIIKRKNSTKVRQYTLNGEFIAEYETITHASKETGVKPPSIANALWGKTNRKAVGYIWIKPDEDINAILERIKEEGAKKKTRAKQKTPTEKKEPRKSKRSKVSWRVERVKEYIFIEKQNLCGAELCMRCSINANGDKCLPCRKDERKDGKQGYWRYSKPLSSF